MVAELDTKVEEAVMVLKELSEDERTWLIEEAIEKERRDWQSRIDGAYEDGVNHGLEKGAEQGREEGLNQGLKTGKLEGLKAGKQEVARNSKALGIPIEQIVKITGLTEAEIRQL